MSDVRSTQAGGVSLAQQYMDVAAQGAPGIQGFLAGLSDDDRQALGVELAMMAANRRRQQAHSSGNQPNNRVAASSGVRPSAAGGASGPGSPGMSAAAAGIKLDPSRAFDVSYIKQVMAQTAAAQGNPPPTQKDFDYWIPKILSIGGKGLDDYWLSRLLGANSGGGGGGSAVGGDDPSASAAGAEDDEIGAEIDAILKDPSNDDKTATQKINAVLKKHGRPTSSNPTAAAPATPGK